MGILVKKRKQKYLSRSFILFLSSSFLWAIPSAEAGPRSSNCTAKGRHSRVADAGKKAMPIAALGVSLLKWDWVGAILSQVLAEGLYVGNHKFEHKIHKKRPCGCDGSFPSGHMIMYASSASYLHYRYGWQYGLPAYIAAIGFSYDRVRSKAHSWGDMLGTAAIVNLITFIVTPRFTDDVEYLPPAVRNFFLPESSSQGNRSPKKKSSNDIVSRVIPQVYAHKGVYKMGFTVYF